jgi:hypothetical protein
MSNSSEPVAGQPIVDASAPTKSFEQWLTELDIEAAKYGSPDTTKQTGSECWEPYFDDGYTPAEAWAEDCSYD